jgi:hypothetical protein
VLLADQDRDALVVGVEEVTRAIVGAMSDKEYLTWRSESGTMPRLNRVFKEMGIHHEEHVVPPKVLTSIEKKKQKATAKNVIVAVESKKRKGQVGSKALSKKQKVVATSAASASPATSSAFASEEGLVEDTGGAQDASTRGEALVDLASGGGGGAKATEVTAEGTKSLVEATMVSVEAAGASMEDPFLDVIGADSSPDASKVSPQGGQSPILVVEVPRPAAHRIVAQVLEEEEDTPDATRLAMSAAFPLHLSKGLMPFVVFGLYFLLSNVIFA